MTMPDDDGDDGVWVPSRAAAVRDVRLVELPVAAIHALAAGDLAGANLVAPFALTPYLVGPECLGVWRRRSAQVVADPASAGWITRVVVDAAGASGGRGVVVGRAGFHGPPDAAGMVEVGYAVDPAHRRRGFASAALVTLLERAACEPEVRTVRATVRPDNLASRVLVLGYGFVAVGEQLDDEDGLETVFEVSVPPAG